jgi:hypothetical protein
VEKLVGFLDDSPDLSVTMFSDVDLASARVVLRGLITIADPHWLEEPDGPLAPHWRSNGPSAASYLIALAQDFFRLHEVCTPRSRRILLGKVRQILRADSEEHFDSLVVEVGVGAELANRLRPIEIEPLVPESQVNSPARPTSPDYSIIVPGGTLFIEVTVFYFGVLVEWGRAAEQLQRALQPGLMRSGLRRTIDLTLPLLFKVNEWPQESLRALAEQVASSDRGEFQQDLPSGGASVRWHPVPWIPFTDDLRSEGLMLPDEDQFALFGGSPEMFGGAVGFTRHILPQHASELLVKSLRNTLNGKRRQCPKESPFLLMIRLGQHQLVEQKLLELLSARIWPNPRYSWLSGVCVFHPQEGFAKRTRRLRLLPNPYAAKPLPDSVLDVFQAKGVIAGGVLKPFPGRRS